MSYEESIFWLKANWNKVVSVASVTMGGLVQIQRIADLNLLGSRAFGIITAFCIFGLAVTHAVIDIEAKLKARN